MSLLFDSLPFNKNVCEIVYNRSFKTACFPLSSWHLSQACNGSTIPGPYRARMTSTTPFLPLRNHSSNDDPAAGLPILRKLVNAIQQPWKNAKAKSSLRRLRPIYLLIIAIILIIISILLGVLLSRAHSSSSHIDVDLGYSKYRGVSKSNGISQWLGMRYAAPPLGDLRFRAAEDPLNTTALQLATTVSNMKGFWLRY